MTGSSPSRIHLIDNLRGAALVAILLLHGVQHFDLYIFPTGGPDWLLKMDHVVAHIAFLLFFGKAYAVFALLFGVSYHIQERNNRRRGVGHVPRMLRRMGLLFGFGFVHGLFYAGDILCILAFYGALLTLLGGLPTRVLLIAAVVLTVQPYLLLLGLQHRTAALVDEPALVLRSFHVLRSGGLFSVWGFNLWEGRVTEWAVLLVSGKFQQMGAWMMLGVIAGRTGYFEEPARFVRLDRNVLVTALLVFAVLVVARVPEDSPWEAWAASWKEAAMLLIYMSGAMLLAARLGIFTAPSFFSAYGRMSLTNYIVQGLLGSVLFYGYGLGLYRCGQTLSLLAVLAVLGAQVLYTRWWAARHARGPLEELWGRLSAGRGTEAVEAS